MFEQSLYESEPVATPLQQGDLFHNYEVRNWELSKRIYQILGVSALVNVFALFIFAQTSLLTMKGCDSPLVGRVCQVLDTVYVGTMLFGTEREYVDAAYDKTDLGDSEITFVDVSGETPPLSYPEGYFQLANPEQYQATLDQANNPTMTSGIPGIPDGFPITTPSTGNSIIDTPQKLPTPNPNVVEGNLPTFGDSGVAANPTTRKRGRGGRVIQVPDIDDNATAIEKPTPSPDPTPLSSEAVTAVEINKKPLTDFADSVSAKWDAKEIDLNQNFTIVVDGVLTEEGKLDRDKSKFDVKKQTGDPKMIDVGKAAMEALGDSGYLNYLKLLGVDKLSAKLVQDDNQITVVITSGQKTPERASTIASGISGYILIGKTVVKNPSDERTLLDGAKVTSDGKNFVLNFAIPKQQAQDMIIKKLKEAQAKKAQPQPNGNSSIRPGDNTAQH